MFEADVFGVKKSNAYENGRLNALITATQRQYNGNNYEQRKEKVAAFFLTVTSFQMENPPHRQTGDCSMWWLIAKLSPMLTPC